MKKILTIDRQNLLDISMQGYGNATAVFLIALHNGISITEELTPGGSLEIPKHPEATDTEVVQYYQNFKVQSVTENTQQEAEPLQGIGSMVIKENFKVR